MKKLAVRKVKNKEAYTLGFVESEEGFPEFESAHDAQDVLAVIELALADYQRGHYWVDGPPTQKGFHLIEDEKGYTLIDHKDNKIERLARALVGNIKRSFKLQ